MRPHLSVGLPLVQTNSPSPLHAGKSVRRFPPETCRAAHTWRAPRVGRIRSSHRTCAKDGGRYPDQECPRACVGSGVCGARGRSRTDTLLKAADFPATSAFAAPGRIRRGFVVWSTPSPWPVKAVGARRLLSTPSPALAGAWLGVSSRHQGFRAFTEFDGLHLGDFSSRAQVSYV